MRECRGLELLEVLRRDRLIDFAPVDVVVNRRGVFEILVVRTATCALARVALKRAVGGELTFTASECHLDESSGGEVGVDGGGTEVDGVSGRRDGRKWHA